MKSSQKKFVIPTGAVASLREATAEWRDLLSPLGGTTLLLLGAEGRLFLGGAALQRCIPAPLVRGFSPGGKVLEGAPSLSRLLRQGGVLPHSPQSPPLGGAGLQRPPENYSVDDRRLDFLFTQALLLLSTARHGRAGLQALVQRQERGALAPEVRFARVPRPCRGFSFATGRGGAQLNNRDSKPVEFHGIRNHGRLLLGGAGHQPCDKSPKIRAALAAEVRFTSPRSGTKPIQSLPLTSAARAAVSVAVNAGLKPCSTQMPPGRSVLVASSTEPALSLPTGRALKVRIRARLQACRKSLHTRPPLGAGLGSMTNPTHRPEGFS